MWKLKLGVTIFIIGFFFIVITKMNENYKEAVVVETECMPTELFGIGNQDRVTRIYDCSNLEEELDNETHIR